MKKLIFFFPLIFLYVYAAIVDEPRLDILLPTPKTYSYISDASNMTLIASNGNNGILNVQLNESFYSVDFGTTFNVSFDYTMNWTGQGYEGVSTKTNWTALDTYYEGVRVIMTFDKIKRHAYVDLDTKTIKYKFYSLYKVNVVGYGIQYYRDLNDVETEISSTSYNSYLSSFDTTFNSLGLLTDIDIPTNVKNQIFDDLLYNFSPTANAGADQIVDFGTNITLNSSSSIDIDGTIATYLWKEGSTTLSTLQSFSKSDLSVGTHNISLTVTDNRGLSSTDTVTVVINSIDNDNDGMSNEYENLNGLNPLDNSDATGDLDGDGKTNLEEYRDETNANDANSRMFTVNLNQGWNLVSLELNVLVDLNALNNNSIEIIRSLQNDTWKVWTKTNTSTSEASLTTLEDGYGYWIKVSADTTLTFKGNSVPDVKPIIENKWQMLGSRNIDDINQFFIDNTNVKVIWKYKDGQWSAVSNDVDITQDLDNKGIPLIYSINNSDGFFVK